MKTGNICYHKKFNQTRSIAISTDTTVERLMLLLYVQSAFMSA